MCEIKTSDFDSTVLFIQQTIKNLFRLIWSYCLSFDKMLKCLNFSFVFKVMSMMNSTRRWTLQRYVKFNSFMSPLHLDLDIFSQLYFPQWSISVILWEHFLCTAFFWQGHCKTLDFFCLDFLSRFESMSCWKTKFNKKLKVLCHWCLVWWLRRVNKIQKLQQIL